MFNISISGLSRDLIIERIDKSLAGPPLSIPVRIIKPDRVWGNGPRRFSNVLSGNWFEWVQVEVELGPTLGITVSLDLLVNKQNTDQPQDWHLPTEQQQEEYSRAVRANITKELESACVKPVWKGSSELRCSAFRPQRAEAIPMERLEEAESAARRERHDDDRYSFPSSLDPRLTMTPTYGHVARLRIEWPSAAER
jgi:hypothetical protein